jgi:hypothetical protein
MIYITAHGYAPTGSNIPDVAESDTGKVLAQGSCPRRLAVPEPRGRDYTLT